jgi:hypothetical protein
MRESFVEKIKEYSSDFLDTFGGQDGAEWIDLHYQLLYAKYIYYVGRGLGFESISDENYDQMENKYKELSIKLNKQPIASDMVGWKTNALLEALAMRQYNEDLYNRLKHTMFKFKE